MEGLVGAGILPGEVLQTLTPIALPLSPQEEVVMSGVRQAQETTTHVNLLELEKFRFEYQVKWLKLREKRKPDWLKLKERREPELEL